MKKKIIIIGGSGMLGKPVVGKFADSGYNVSVLTTNPEKTKTIFDNNINIIKGDVTDTESLTEALAGHEYGYLNLNAHLDEEKYEKIEIGGTKNVATVAKILGIKRIGMISGASSKGVETGIIYRDAKVRAEKELIKSGVPYTIFRPSWFFESLPMFIQQGRAGILGKQPLELGWLAAVDYAQQVVKAFESDEAANKSFYCLGPEKMTMMSALEKFCDYHYPELTPSSMSFMQAKMLANFPGMEVLKAVIPFFEYFETNTEDVDPSEANELLGANPTTIDEWLKSYKKP